MYMIYFYNNNYYNAIDLEKVYCNTNLIFQ